MSDSEADRLLVRRFLASRDEASFRALYRRHTPFLFRFLLRLTGGRDGDAQEGVQETWVRAAARLKEFQWRSTLKTWLAGIALRWWREEARRSGREAVSIESEDVRGRSLLARRAWGEVRK